MHAVLQTCVVPRKLTLLRGKLKLTLKLALKLEPELTSIRERIKRTTKRKKALQEQAWANDDWTKGNFKSAEERWQTAFNICNDITDSTAMKDILYEMADAFYNSAFYNEAFETYECIIALDFKETFITC